MPLLFGSINWQNLTAYVTFLTLIGSIFLWVSNKIYNFGGNAHRLTTIEKSLEIDVKPQLIRLEKRMDQMYEILLTLKK